ncbi:4-hydroxythreonine-4-phosphate dehydrogenase PdxA [Pseudorhodobacter sp. MZDSW-24AT]|uniref:4-hydroxythreonine-4-phosphate dehydrogenase PdxA n=1 Tax=Pseudorhodobacter sp. MZDSW-24AT TaxID=2052957 RepID=UPI000C1E5308|nr:4-hydroxythreonine-4-phosphate dehydrogenase PdxA [Pseudorhodobacter sp. MZDSW-24AT]PJF10976.1 4-hydroxythreonine-4-phosphate dehydrogenase PdxA [Pseudorhodobacter sp. MZDSW-24AT]
MTPQPLVMTCGEPAGIGPELAPRARAILGSAVPFVWLGDPRHLPPGTPWAEVAHPAAARDVPASHLPVLPHRFAAPATPGTADPANAIGVVEVIARAVALVQEGAAGGIVTAPLNKKVLKDGAGFAFPGHTEYLAHLAGDVPVVMMLASPLLRVVPATIHIPLAAVPAALTQAHLEQVIRLTHAGLIRDFGFAAPRIAVAGLNPHAGEGGAMGHEDGAVIAPVVARLAAEGLAVTGPWPADTLFHSRARAGYEAAVCAYHDQALIPIKTLDFDGGVNVTLGLPFIRTSPDHGTAFDIAGKGLALPDSLVAAARMAWEMALARQRVV